MTLLRIELINDTPPSNKFYWLEVVEHSYQDLSLKVTRKEYYVYAYWGRCGHEQSARSQRKLSTICEQNAKKFLYGMVSQKEKKGYTVLHHKTTPTKTAPTPLEQRTGQHDPEEYILFVGNQ